jgi:hypothetical protein
MNVIGDQFPVPDYAPRVLALIPATEATAENPALFSFVLWMCDRPGVVQAFPAEFCGPFVRLFAQPESEIAASKIEPETLQQLRRVLARLVSVIPNGSEICAKICRNNAAKLSFLSRALDIA